MFSAKISIAMMFLVWFFLTSDCDAWRRRRRRRRRCPVQNCVVASWSSWSSCTVDRCGEQGHRSRSRTIVSKPSCGGTACPDNLVETRQCYGSNPVDCVVASWSSWSSCTVDRCGEQGHRSRSRTIVSGPSCGGTACPDNLVKTRQCYGSNPVDCVVASWSSWSSCTVERCGEQGHQRRSRTIVSKPSCGGTACPDNLVETRQCYGNKPVDCVVASWSYWSYCTVDRCGEQGHRRRSRTIVSKPSCGGTACPENLVETRQCYGSKPVDCQLSYWSGWSGCTTPCGVSGTQSRSRHRITTEQCGGTCSSSLRRTRSCPHLGCFNGGSLRDGACFCKVGFSGDCCQKQGNISRCGGLRAIDCLLSSWSEWSACSTKCGVGGKQNSTRSQIIPEQCGGTCPGGSNLTMTRACPQMSCWYGGTLTNGVCICKAGYYGVCCDIAAKDTDRGTDRGTDTDTGTDTGTDRGTDTDTDTGTDKGSPKIPIWIIVLIVVVLVVIVIVIFIRYVKKWILHWT